jgi:diguanylate cyclase (GGDEF)-like protein
MTGTLSAQLALAVVESCPLPLLVTDRLGRMVGFNRAFAELVGQQRADELCGHSYADLAGCSEQCLLSPATTACWSDGKARRHHFEIHDLDLHDPDYAQARLLVDISRRVELEQAHKALEEKLKQHILTDRDTGLLNRNGVMLALEPQVARSRRYNRPLAVVVLHARCQDEDHATQQRVARLLKDQLRWADLVGCTQRGEFILVLPETTAEAAEKVTCKLQELLQEMAECKLAGHPMLICYGIAGWRRKDSADSLLKRAVTALSQARARHRSGSIAV